VRSARVGIVGLVAAALLPLSWGCGGGPPPVESSTEEAKVAGRVQIRGKPATGGMVVFDPTNVRRKMATVRKADIGPDGAYSITTLIGDNTVRVEGIEAEKAGVQFDMVTVDVKRGENEIPIALPPAR
jgi:hypothetical protein